MSIVTIDFETYWDKDFSLTKLTQEQYIRDPRFEALLVSYKVDDGEVQWAAGSDIRPTLESLNLQNHYVLCHNTAFDGAILAWQYNIVPKYFLDTLSMARALHGTNVGNSLKSLAEMYKLGAKGDEVTRTQGKRLSQFTDEELERFGEYCRTDTELTYQLFKCLSANFPQQELYIIDMMLRMFICPALVLDKALLSEYHDKIREKKQMLIDRLGGVEKAALMSNPQFAALLEKLNVEVPKKISPRTGKETFALAKNDQGLQDLLEHPDPRVQTLVATRLGVKNTQEETRTLHFMQIAERGRLPIPLRYYGGHTGRASGDGKINLQNLQRGGTLRKAICAPEGHVLVAVDSAQIEARVLAWFAGETELVNAFAKGEDIYSKFASTVYGYTVTKAEHKEERHVGKTAILGLGYNMGAEKFCSALKTGNPPIDIPAQRCEQIVGLYRSQYSEISGLWRKAQNALQKMANNKTGTLGAILPLAYGGGVVELPNGMQLLYPDLKDIGDGFTYRNRQGQTSIYGGKLVENIVQALARIIVFHQMSKISKALREAPTDGLTRQVVLTVHDEVVVVVPEQEADNWLKTMTLIMSTAPKWAEGCPIACEGAIGKNYGECK